MTGTHGESRSLSNPPSIDRPPRTLTTREINMAATQPTGTQTKPANGTAKPSSEPPKLTAQGYVIAVLRARENQKPREKKLLERVIPEERAKAEALLEKLSG